MFTGWTGVKISMASVALKSVWRMCRGALGFPDEVPEYRHQLPLLCACCSGVGHPGTCGLKELSGNHRLETTLTKDWKHTQAEP